MILTKTHKMLLYFVIFASFLTVGVSIFWSVARFKEPYFLKTYSEELFVNYYDENDTISPTKINFELRYLSNADENRLVDNIEFPDAYGDTRVSFKVSEQNSFVSGSIGYFSSNYNDTLNIERMGMYNLHYLDITVTCANEIENLEPLSLKNATVYFSDGSVMNIEIGELRIHFEPVTRIMQNYTSGKSADMVSETSLSVISNEDLKVFSFKTSPVLGEEQFLELKLDDIAADDLSVNPFLIENNQRVKFVAKFLKESTLFSKFDSYQLHIIIEAENSEGTVSDYYCGEIRATRDPKNVFEIMPFAFSAGRGDKS